MFYTYKLRLYPNNIQKVLLAKHFGSVRFIYNYFLSQKQEAYQKKKKTLSYVESSNLLTKLKKNEEYKWLKEINSQTLQITLKNLDSAYNMFFRKLAKFPRFKSKKDNKQSYGIHQGITIIGNKVKIPKFKEGIKVVLDREVNEEIRFGTISKKTNQYFISLTVEKEIKHKPTLKKAIGIDLGINTLVVCSDGKKYKNIRAKRTLERRMKILQRRLSKKQKGSKNKEKARIKLARIHLKISNQRNDYLHKVTTSLVNENQIIVMEDLNVKGMAKNHCLANNLSDASFGMIEHHLKYKSEWYGRTLIQVGRFYPSSKTCYECGYINQNLTLRDRIWECPRCHSILDRDLNASKNILWYGIKSTLGTREIEACGLSNYGINEQSLVSSDRMKQEVLV